MESKAEEFEANSNVIRQDLVNTAVKFLENPKVQSTPLAQKQNFLQRKGLTNEEIKLACERSGAYTLHEEHTRREVMPPPISPLQPYGYASQGQQQISIFSRIREVVHNMAILGFIAYVVYKFYERYIAPFLFGKKKKTVEESIEDLSKNVKSSVEEIQSNLTSVKVEVDRLSRNSGYNASEQLSELKSEVATVKGLLLSRKQFPPMSSTVPVVPPSIPAWQMASVHQSDPDTDHDRKSDGSGGSSEPEHCTHKSDSSLEIIYLKESDSESYHARKSGDEDRD